MLNNLFNVFLLSLSQYPFNIKKNSWDHEIKADGKVIECVQEYNYFGQLMGVCLDHEKETKEDGWDGVHIGDNTML